MWRIVVLFSLTLLRVGAQTAVQAASGSWIVLDGTWRWQAGDNPQWASSTFDDSQWSPLPVPGPLPQLRQYWIRLPVQMGTMSDPGLLLGPIAFAYEVYWDGQRIGHFGNLSREIWFTPRWQTFRLPGSLTNGGRHTLALRIGQIGSTFGTRAPRLDVRENRIGDFQALHEVESALLSAAFQPRLLQLLIDFGLILAGLYFLLLPPVVAQGAAFRWLGVILLSRALLVMDEFFVNYGPLAIPHSIPRVLVGVLYLLYMVGPIEFSFALFRRPVPLAVRCLEGLLFLFALPLRPPAPLKFGGAGLLLVSAFAPVVLAGLELRKRTREAGSALFLFILWSAVTFINILVMNFHVRVSTAIQLGGFSIWLWDAALLVWVPAVAMQIHKANLRFRDERERLHRELEAARQVQQLLLPSQSLEWPGFAIEAQYQPATEVGGDFFQLFPSAPDSLLLVIGDVSGKGMKAALLVSMVVGALRNRRSDQPSCVLQELNAVLLPVSEGGFTTCCCALIAPDGTVTLANAGHFAPYCNGEEVTTPSALPLGLTSGAEWEEIQFQLQPNDRLLWISDGVIEARNSKQELLGFERTQKLARQSASAIVRAAQDFGQQDDITVLSITRQKTSLRVASA